VRPPRSARLLICVILSVIGAPYGAGTEPSAGAAQYEAVPGAPPLHADTAADAEAFVARVLESDTTGKIEAAAAEALLANALALGESLVDGAARARWRTLQARRRWRLRRARARAGAPGHDCGASGRGSNAPPDPEDEKEEQPQQEQQPLASQARGVLVVAGGTDGFANADILIRALRHVGCRLPVEVVYYGAGEYDPGNAELLLGLDGLAPPGDASGGVEGARAGGRRRCGNAQDSDGGGGGGGGEQEGTVRLVDGTAYHRRHLGKLAPHRRGRGGHVEGFSTKVHALAFVTSFEQALLLDADNLAVQVWHCEAARGPGGVRRLLTGGLCVGAGLQGSRGDHKSIVASLGPNI
jgi:hypothetical protein